MSLHRTVTLLGFKRPSVKAGTVTLDVVCGAGECLSLVVTRTLWSQLNAAVQAARMPLAESIILPTRPQSPRCTSEQMEAAWVELASGSRAQLKDIAERHGVLPGSFGNWCRLHHPARYVALQRIRNNRGNLADYATAGLPLPKPSATSL